MKRAAEPDLHQIGEVAERVGLSLRTIRHYEEIGLILPSGRSVGGFRLYTDADIERLHFVKQLKPLDFSLEEMRNLLEARDRVAQDIDAEERTELLDRLKMFGDAAATRCERLREQLQAAEAVANTLRREASGRARSSRRLR